jgi:predicted nucleic acid-binding protein
MSVLLDTNVLSELLRAQPDSSVLAWFAAMPANGLFVSAVTQAEMLLGAQLLPAGRRRQGLEQALAAMFLEDFSARVLPFDSRAAADYAAVVATRRGAGTPISQFDAQIAAIALSHRLGLVTRNVSDFDGCGLALINPWAFDERAKGPP